MAIVAWLSFVMGHAPDRDGMTGGMARAHSIEHVVASPIALGTNAKAANFTGINNDTIMLFTYTLSGILASLAGIIIASRTSSVKWDYGSSYLLVAILIAVMGGVNPSGGWGKMLGVVLASFALQLLSSTLNFLGTSNFLKDFTWGLLLLLSIVLTGTRLSGFVKLKPARDS